jgi:hypothetical protein
MAYLFPIAATRMAIASATVVIAVVFAQAYAGERPRPAMMTAEDLAVYMPDGGRIETRLDADLTGDGLRDLAFVAANDDVRVLKVMVSYVNEFDMGYDPVGEMRMGDSPLGAAKLSVKNGVLLVEDLDGGTTATQSLYRFRFDPKQRRMRLIGDDVTMYSRTFAHDGVSISTNRLNGAQVKIEKTIVDGAYIDQPAQRSKVSTKPLYMEEAPLPQGTLGFGDH